MLCLNYFWKMRNIWNTIYLTCVLSQWKIKYLHCTLQVTLFYLGIIWPVSFPNTMQFTTNIPWLLDEILRSRYAIGAIYSQIYSKKYSICIINYKRILIYFRKYLKYRAVNHILWKPFLFWINLTSKMKVKNSINHISYI